MSRPEVVAHDWALARSLDARISVHVGMRITGVHGHPIAELHDAGLLGADTTYVHVTTNTDDELSLDPWTAWLGVRRVGRESAFWARRIRGVDALIHAAPEGTFSEAIS